jgi:hypothetical protein
MRLYFHLIDGHRTILDYEGAEVADARGVRKAVIDDVRELVAEFSEEERRGWTLEVVDAAGSILLTIRLGDMIH